MAAIAIHSHTSTLVLLSLSLILFAGFFATRVTKLFRLPNVSGYIIAGMLIGPGMLHIIPEATIENLSFISDVALAFIAFDVGRFFKKEVICGSGTKVVVITIFEALVAGVAVSVAMRFMFSFSWDFSLLLGAIATATAPASTLMTINQYGAKGEFVNTLLQVVAFDDAVCLFAFTLATAFIGISGNEGKGLVNLLAPLFFNILALVLGFLSGLVLKRMITEKRSNENRLILVIAFLLAISGICVILNVSPLLSCMLFGAVYINLTEDRELYRQINNFSPPIMSTFFIYSGMSLDLGSLKAFGAAGGFDETFDSCWCEAALSLTLAQRGRRNVVTPDVCFQKTSAVVRPLSRRNRERCGDMFRALRVQGDPMRSQNPAYLAAIRSKTGDAEKGQKIENYA